MKRALAALALFALGQFAASGHIGSPTEVYEGMAGAVPVRVIHTVSS